MTLSTPKRALQAPAQVRSKKETKEGTKAKFQRLQLRRFLQSIRKLDKQYPTDRARIDKIYKMVIGKKCCDCCGGKKFKHASGSRKIYCLKCGKDANLTAGTIFHGMRKVRPFFTAVLLSLRGVAYNANQLHVHLGIQYDPARDLVCKIMGSALTELSGEGKKVSTLAFDKIIQKRSVETEARQHPSTEQLDELRSYVDRDDGAWFKKIIDDFLNGDGFIDENFETTHTNCRRLYDLLADKPLSTETLSSRSGLSVPDLFIALSTLSSCKLVLRNIDGRYKRIEQTLADATASEPSVNQKILEAITFIEYLHTGVSRRYLQLYLAAYWCYVNFSRKKGARLSKRFCQKNFNQVNIDSYVSPLLLNFCPS